MHPDNVRALHEARIHYCSLANNHTLDFKEKGLMMGYRLTSRALTICKTGMFDTMKHLDDAGIAWAGVGKNADEAYRPAFLKVKGVNIALYRSDSIIKADLLDEG